MPTDFGRDAIDRGVAVRGRMAMLLLNTRISAGRAGRARSRRDAVETCRHDHEVFEHHAPHRAVAPRGDELVGHSIEPGTELPLRNDGRR